MITVIVEKRQNWFCISENNRSLLKAYRDGGGYKAWIESGFVWTMKNKIKHMTRQKRTPSSPLTLMYAMYNEVLPSIHRELAYWKKKAEQIPDVELRKQALASIQTKQFHCEGGGVYALLAPVERRNEVYAFIVAYQTISDYLDNLCDRSVSLDEQNFRQLHQAMIDALSNNTELKESSAYYQFQEHREDGGYLGDLVQTCRERLARLPGVEHVRQHMQFLSRIYCDLQVYKHIHHDRREEALLQWFDSFASQYPQISWYEFAAATGSTLGIFYFASLSAGCDRIEGIENVLHSYFPYVQGVHILLDYFIDQMEDEQGGDLNFCTYYATPQERDERIAHFYRQAKQKMSSLPHPHFHRMIIDGLYGIYLSDPKVNESTTIKKSAKRLLRQSSMTAKFFHLNSYLIHRFGRKV